MAKKAYRAYDLGGGTGGLKTIDGTVLNDADTADVIDSTNNKCYFYTLDASSGAAESSPDIISPTSNAGNKRWILTECQSFNSYMRGITDSSTFSAFITAVGTAVEHIWVPVKAMTPLTTNGCAPIMDYEYGGADVMKSYMAFAGGATDQRCMFDLVMPSTWNRGTIKCKFYWAPGDSACSAGDIVTWGISGTAIADDDAIDTAMGAWVYLDDTVLAGKNGDLHITGKSAAITVAGVPALGELLQFKVRRDADASDGGDNMPEDAWLFGVVLEITNSNTVAAW